MRWSGLAEVSPDVRKEVPPKGLRTRLYLYAYLDELEHRFNNRSNKFLFRNTLLKLVKADKLPYAELTKQVAA